MGVFLSFQLYFSHIVTVTFIDENFSTRIEPQIWGKCTRYNDMWQILSQEFVSSAPRTTDLNWTQIFSAGLRVMVFNATFNNISAISWWSVLLVYPEKTTDMPQGTDKLYHIML